MNRAPRLIDELYFVFSIYPAPPKGNGCPCCVSESDEMNLHSGDLRALSAGDLGRYSFKAITTWGTVDDYKYYLPRILELLISDDTFSDDSVFFGKLKYAKFDEWPVNEKDAVEKVVREWWRKKINEENGFPSSFFLDLSIFFGSVKLPLELWNLDRDGLGYKNFLGFVYHHANEIILEEKLFGEKLKPTDHSLIAQFAFKNAEKLANDWFHFEKLDAELAQEISTACDIIDNLKKFYEKND